MLSRVACLGLVVAWGCASVVRPNTALPKVYPPTPEALQPGNTGDAVLTQHNDNFRTGANLHEQTLTTANVTQVHFGLLYSLPVDGQVYAQPLYVPEVDMHDGKHSVVIVATMHNSVYAFDADGRSMSPLWSDNLGDAVDFDFFPMVAWYLGKYNIYPEIGITSTPVIDLSTNRIYIAAKVRTRRGFLGLHWGERVVYRLHALDVRTGKDVPASPVEISASVSGWGRGTRFGKVTFDPVRQLQRPGLLLSRGRVYIAFASHQDTEPYHGWLMAYDAQTLEQTVAFCTTCKSFLAGEGGIWQAGNGPASDADGNLFVMTGNGTWDPSRNEFGTSFLKLTPELTPASWFTPTNYACLNHIDADLGSAGPLLLPRSNFMVGGGKEGVVYVVNRDALGGLESHSNARAEVPCEDSFKGTGQPPVFSFQAALPYDAGMTHELDTLLLNKLIPSSRGWHYHHIHGSPIYWETPHGNFIYVWPERDSLRAFRINTTNGAAPGAVPPGDRPRSTFRSAVADGIGMPGAALSLSSSGDGSSAIVWASLPDSGNALTDIVPGVLRAFSALPEDVTACDRRPGTDACILRQLWSSEDDPSDEVGLFAKYTPPTIAGGKVYVATFSNAVRVYGLRDKSRLRQIRIADRPLNELGSARFVRQTTPPAQMEPGQHANVSVTFRNDGQNAWLPDRDAGILSQHPSGNLAWRRDSIVPLRAVVPPGAEYTFDFSVVAPREGRLSFQWRMTARGRPFGDTTANVSIAVISPRCSSLRAEYRRAMDLAAADTIPLNGRNAEPKEFERLLTNLTDISDELAKRLCVLRPDAAFPEP